MVEKLIEKFWIEWRSSGPIWTKWGISDPRSHDIAVEFAEAYLASNAPAGGETPNEWIRVGTVPLRENADSCMAAIPGCVWVSARFDGKVWWNNITGDVIEPEVWRPIPKYTTTTRSVQNPSESHAEHVRELVKAARKAMEQIQIEFYDEAYEALDAALAHFEKE